MQKGQLLAKMRMPLLFLCSLRRKARVSQVRWLLAFSSETRRQMWQGLEGRRARKSSWKPASLRIQIRNYQTNQSFQKLKTPTLILLTTDLGRISHQSLYMFESSSRRISNSSLYEIDRSLRSSLPISLRIKTGQYHVLNISRLPSAVCISNIYPTHYFTILQLGFMTSAQKSRNSSLMDQGRILAQIKYLERTEDSQRASQCLETRSLVGWKLPMQLQLLILSQEGN